MNLRGSVSLILATAAVVLACGGGQRASVAAASPAAVSSRCPDLGKPEEVSAFDFASEYQLSRDAADKLKAAALGSIEIDALESKLDAELGIACAQVAQSLGDRGDWRSGGEACAAAVKAVREARAKLGPRASAKLVVREPLCLVDASLMTKCAAICDSSVPAEKVKAECEQRVGRCDGQCDGACESKNAKKCEGECSGACDGAMKGTCGGRCRGTCDGRPWNGPCAGVCAGTCSAALVGECKGKCTGTCKFSKPTICDQLCAGTCSVELADAKCAGDFKTPDVSTDCRARCEIAAINQTECSTPQVGLVVSGGASHVTADAMKSAVDRAFPALLEILYEVGDKGGKRILNAQAVIDGARSGFREMARSGGKATAAASEKQLVTCFDEPFKRSVAAASAVKTLLDQAQGVRDEATR